MREIDRDIKETLQSIDSTLKRIEDILLEKKNPLQDLQDAVADSISKMDCKNFSKIIFRSIHGTCEEVQSSTKD